ncbi:MAG: hypothetical protein NVSMB4_11150 [Acidimicrobiales bacterium]
MDVDAAWRDYADRIKAAGELISGEDYSQDPRLRAEGYRYVARLLALASQLYLEFSSSEQPTLLRYGDDVTTFGATNVDNQYLRAFVDPAGTYRLSGNVQGAKEILFSVQDGEFIYGKTAVLAECSVHDLDLGPDGELDLILGGPDRPRNWLPLGADAAYINIRQFIADWERDPIAELFIERIDAVAPAAPVTGAEIGAALDRIARWVETSVPLWNSYSKMTFDFTPVNAVSAPSKPAGSAENMLHGGTQWDLPAGKALLIELEQPVATYWSFQTYMPGWLQPLDFANRVTSLNDAQAHIDDDGKIRIVVSHDDPGLQNWLDTTGLPKGAATYRYVRASNAPCPVAKVVELAGIRAELPSSTPEFTAADRRAQLRARKRGVARRFHR